MKKIYVLLIILFLVFTYRYYYSNYIFVYPFFKNDYHTFFSHEEFPDGIISPIKRKLLEKEIKNFINNNQEEFKKRSQQFEFDINKLKIISIDHDKNNNEMVLVTMGISDEQILFYLKNNKVTNFDIEN